MRTCSPSTTVTVSLCCHRPTMERPPVNSPSGLAPRRDGPGNAAWRAGGSRAALSSRPHLTSRPLPPQILKAVRPGKLATHQRQQRPGHHGGRPGPRVALHQKQRLRGHLPGGRQRCAPLRVTALTCRVLWGGGPPAPGGGWRSASCPVPSCSWGLVVPQWPRPSPSPRLFKASVIHPGTHTVAHSWVAGGARDDGSLA